MRFGELMLKTKSRVSSLGARAVGWLALPAALGVLAFAVWVIREAESKAAQSKTPLALAAGNSGRGTQAAGFAFVALDTLQVTGDSVLVSWDSNPEPDLAGYRVWLARGSDVLSYEAGSATQLRIRGVQAGLWAVDVTAVNTAGDESDHSAPVWFRRVATPPVLLPCDIDGDGDADAADVTAFLAAMFTKSGQKKYNVRADFDHDGDVDADDHRRYNVNCR